MNHAAAAPPIARVQTADPVGTTIRAMGQAARQASQTWTVREWAARLATQAPPRDYRAQLAALYGGILDRWRYVQEPGEWVTSTGDAAIKYTLGTAYNCKDWRRCDVAGIPAARWQRGWGDCDDVAVVAAAGARALGMSPYFRAVFSGGGGHVAAIVRTPAGEWVSVDPVGHPTHQFGWRHGSEAAGDQIAIFDLDGRMVRRGDPDQPTRIGAVKMYHPTPYNARRGIGAIPDFTLGAVQPDPLSRVLFAGTAPGEQKHMVILKPHAQPGARVLAMPEFAARVFQRGGVLEGCEACDQFGQVYDYRADLDAWAPVGSYTAGVDVMPGGFSGVDVPAGFGRTGRARRRVERRRRVARRRRERRQRRRAAVRRTVRRVGRAIKRVGRVIRRGLQRIAARLISSKLFRAAACTAVQAFGVPIMVCQAFLKAVGQLLKDGGVTKLIKLMVRRKWKAIAEILKRVGGALIREGPKALKNLGTWGVNLGSMERAADAMPTPNNPLALALDDDTEYRMDFGGGYSYRAAPVAAMVPVLGMTEPQQLIAADTPTLGRWYRIKRGDSLLTIAEKAIGTRTGRLTKAKQINAVQANQAQTVATREGFDRTQFGARIISMNPRHADDPAEAIRGEGGRSYAMIYIPETDEEPPAQAGAPEMAPDMPDLPPAPDAQMDPDPEATPTEQEEPEGDVILPPEPPEPARPMPGDNLIAETPTPGRWYRIKRGDALLTIAEKAIGSRTGRLTKAKRINAVQANQAQTVPTREGFDRTQFGARIISMNPRHAAEPGAAIRGEFGRGYAVIYIPRAGEEPSDTPGAVIPTPEPPPEPRPIKPITPPIVPVEPPPPPPEPEPVPLPPVTVTPKRPITPSRPPIVVVPAKPTPRPVVDVCGQANAALRTRVVPCGTQPVGNRGELPRYSPENDGCIVCEDVAPPRPAPAPAPMPAPRPTPAPAPMPAPRPTPAPAPMPAPRPTPPPAPMPPAPMPPAASDGDPWPWYLVAATVVLAPALTVPAAVIAALTAPTP